MRLLALETSIAVLKKRSILQGEQEILAIRRHPLRFVFPFILSTCISVVLATVFLAGFMNAESPEVSDFFLACLGLLALYYFFAVCRSYIGWQYNFLILTAQKIVIVEQVLFFFQHVNSIPLDNIVSTMSESRFLGIWHCGTLNIFLSERKGGTTKEVMLHYIPRPEIVAGAIENAMTLHKQKSAGETPEDQAPKIQEVQHKVEETLPQAIEPGTEKERGTETMLVEQTNPAPGETPAGTTPSAK